MQDRFAATTGALHETVITERRSIIERISPGVEPGEDDTLREYDPVAAARDNRAAILRVLGSPTVRSEFKDAVRQFAAGRRLDLEELGNLQAAGEYDLPDS